MRTIYFASFIAVLTSCTQARTQVMVVVTADDMVRTRADRILVELQGAPGEGGPFGVPVSHTVMPPAFPIRVPIVPQDNDASRYYRVTISAMEGSIAVAQVRAISGFVEGRTLALPLHMDEGCLDHVCPGADETCVVDGLTFACRGAHVGAAALEPYEEPQMDAGRREDAGEDPVDGGGARCGNMRTDDGESCDDGDDRNGTYGWCNADCSGPGPFCGDGVVDEANEECEPDVPPCTDACVVPKPGCGDSFSTPGEICYDGAALTWVSDSSTAVGAGDFTADGIADIALAGEGRFLVVRQVAGGGLEIAAEMSLTERVAGIATPDFDLDGVREIVVPNVFCGRTCVAVLDSMLGLDYDLGYSSAVQALGGGSVEDDAFADMTLIQRDSAFGFNEASIISNEGGVLRQGPATMIEGALGGGRTPIRTFVTPPSVSGEGRFWVLWDDAELQSFEVLAGDRIDELEVTGHRMSGCDPSTNGASLGLAEITGEPPEEFLLACADASGNVQTHLMDPGRGTPSVSFPWPSPGRIVATFAVDVDADDDNDAILVQPTAITILPLTDGVPSEGVTIDAPFGCVIRDAAMTDFNGDDLPDFAFASECGVHVLLAQP
jgi:hypothetical protein